MKEIDINPKKTCALVVGMDNYPQLGTGWDLDNAVREATEFAAWLLKLGVTADRIKLFLSGGEEPYLQDRAGNPLASQAPSTQNIRAAILNQPFATDAPDNLLFVYWAGHGWTDVNLHQLLFDLDSSPKDKLVFDLETVKEALRAKAWQYFPRQIFLVNACANEPPGHCNKQQFKDLDSEGHLNRKQFTICAASPGQRAYDYSPLPLVSTIQKAISRQGRLDLREYCERICETAESLRQTPRIEWVDWNGSRDGWSGDALVRFLHQKLKKCHGVDFTEHLKPLYRQCVEKVENVQSIWEIVSHLEAEKSQAITRYGPVLDFVLHVIHCYNSADSVSQLDRELTTLFEQEPEYDLPLLATARGEIEKKYRQPVEPLYLSIVPGEHGDSFWFYLHDSTGWRIINEDIRIAADETLEAAFQRAILEREAKLMGFELHFHFFLRIEKLNLDLHEWQDPTLPGEEEHLEKNHYVAVRCWERAKGTDPGWGFALDRWRRKTRILKTRPFQARPRINWVAEPDGCDWEGSIEAHECVGFHQPPVNKWLRSAMLKGLPFLIWPRQSVENWKICREKLDAIELHGGWHGMQDHFPRIRRQHREAPFAVLWDDPDHNPYADETKARAHVPFADLA